MKILTVCSNEYTAPPPDNVIHASLYISSLLAEGLAKKGHAVTYLCAMGSSINTARIYTKPPSFFETINRNEWDAISDKGLRSQLIAPFDTDLHLEMLQAVDAEKFDVIHFHSTPCFLSLPFASRTQLPNIFTLHGISSEPERKVIDVFNNKNNYFISISNNQRKQFNNLSFTKTIYHGVPIDRFGFNAVGGNQMFFSGRLKRIKGVEEAIFAALKAHRQLQVSGDIRRSEKDYFYKTVLPLIDHSNGLVKFLDFVNRSLIGRFFGESKLFLFPIQWEEPFGLVMIESMAAGTPVVAFARGSVPEVIKDGETGFIVNPAKDDIRGDWIVKKTGIEGLCEAVERIYSMPKDQYQSMRRACRAHVEKYFTLERMVNDYERVYQSILDR